MAHRFSPADAAACAAAAVGAWFTRGSLDVFAGPRGTTRVAMLPAPVEFVGLAALACLAALLLQRILAAESRIRGSSRPASLRHLLLPLVSLVALALPYLPWLPDAVPAWQALAGPARFALWGVVCGQVAWIAIDAWLERQTARNDQRERPDDAREPAPRGGPAAVVFLASVAAGAALAAAIGSDAFVAGLTHASSMPLAVRVVGPAVVSVLMWYRAVRVAGSHAAGTAAWLAIAASAPWVLSGFFVAPAQAAAACVVLAAGWPGGNDDGRAWAAAVRGSALAILPWLGTEYLLFAVVLAACVAWRMRGSAGGMVAAGAPLVLSAAARIAIEPQAWRAVMLAPDGSAWSPAAALAGQQDGVLLYAPAIALAVPGLWRLWRDGGSARIAAIEAAAGTAALLLAARSPGSPARALAIPGASLIAALPLLVPAVARWVGYHALSISRMALVRVLVLWGIFMSVSLAIARDGAVLLRSGTGASGLLDWLAPARDLVRIAPMAPAPAADAIPFVVAALIWAAVAAGLCWIIGRLRLASQAGAAVTVTVGALIALTVGELAIERTLGPRLPPRVAPALRTQAHMLDDFDARRRPLAVVFDSWRTMPPAGVPPLFSFDAWPGARRHPQPVRVLLNARLSLPAGEYVITLRPKPGGALNGTAGLQVGRIGPPMRQWQIAAAPGAAWTAGFTLPVDASFVGLRTTPEFESTVAALRVQPARAVNDGDRRGLPTVLSAATYKDVMVTFHGDEVYAERDGFWVRGRSTLLATFAPPDTPGRAPGVRLSMHGGAAPTNVRFETTTWGTTVALLPDVPRELLVPALPGQPLLPVRITTESGFVPADTDGGSDRRLLGCWIEVLE